MKYEPHPNRRRLLIGLTAFCAVPLPVRAKLTPSALVGAGASLPTKLYEAWGKRFTELTQVPFHYAAVGSGQGWQLITAGNANFGTTEIPEELPALDAHKLIQFPVANAAIVLVVNLPGVQSNQLRLTPALVGQIYTGQTRHWRDPSILKINPDIELPDLSITPVSRLGSSGTTFALSRYLNSTDESWRDRIGLTSKARWDYGLLAQGTSALEAVTARTLGSIGYLVAGRRLPNTLAVIALGDAEQGFVKAPATAAVIENWQLTTASYALLRQTPSNPLDQTAVEYLRSGVTVWQDLTRKVGFSPLTSKQQQSVLVDLQKYGLTDTQPK
jgi:phosphate transport system substrate-binding protein